MIRGLPDHAPTTEAHPFQRTIRDRAAISDAPIKDYGIASPASECADVSAPRKTPRVSMVVVLPENHAVMPDKLAEGLRASGAEEVDVLIACAGQPANLNALQRCVGKAQFLLAPAGTSAADLRELAMSHATGDIVTLLSGAVLHGADVAERSVASTC